MTPDELREKIARDQGWTMCRCGHILECCADCRHWLLDESPRIARAWSWFVNNGVFGTWEPAGQDLANFAERADLAYWYSLGWHQKL